MESDQRGADRVASSPHDSAQPQADYVRPIRTPDQRLRVFISSTLEELAPERAAAKAAVVQLHLTPVLFELGARPYPPRELYRAYLAQSDVFLGIYWQRYGWVAPGMVYSGLEDEYRLAGQRPKLVYVKDPAPDREPGLVALLGRVREDDVSYRKFSSPDELRGLVADDLALLLTERFAAETTGSPPSIAFPQEPPSRLPLWRAPIVDRQNDDATIRTLLESDDTGLVTLTGPGGVGKTRLVVQAASESTGSFPDGVVFVPLASVREPAGLLPAIAQALRLSPSDGRSVGDALMEYLRPKAMLLVLDNVEQLVSAAPELSRVLEAAPRLKILATSREPLRISAEHVVPLAPLEMPDAGTLPDLELLSQIPAVELFLRRAREVRPDFSLTRDNATPIVEICRRLDGLPLAIELAAARLAVLTPAALLARLGRRLPLLTHGARDLPARQQTLRDTLAWSYDLLSPDDQRLFRLLGAFAGLFSLDAVEAVRAEPPGGDARERRDALDGLGSLVDKSLVQTAELTDGEARFSMLETIREYAAERLAAEGEEADARERHAAYFLALAEEAEPHFARPEREAWHRRLERDVANLRAALTWYATPGARPANASRPDSAAAVAGSEATDRLERGLLMASALGWFWLSRGYLLEGRTWLDDFLAKVGDRADPKVRARGLYFAGILAWAQGDSASSVGYVQESIALFRSLGDEPRLGYALILGGLLEVGDGRGRESEPLLDESIAIFRRLGDAWGEAWSTYYASFGRYMAGEPEAARRYAEDSRDQFERLRDPASPAMAASARAIVAMVDGDGEKAIDLLGDAITLSAAGGDRNLYVQLLVNVGTGWVRGLATEQDRRVLLKGLRLGLQVWRELRRPSGTGLTLAGLAEVAASQGEAERAGRHFGAAKRLLPSGDRAPSEAGVANLDERIARARAMLDADAFDRGLAAGLSMTEDEAVDFALRDG